MTAARIFLGISALIWLPYGIFLVFVPGYLDGVAGLVAQTPTGVTEIRAMYGGLQAAIGVMCCLALLRPHLVGHTLMTLAFLTGGLATARAVGLLLDGGASTYTLGALAFEIVSTSIAFALAQQHSTPASQATAA